MLRSKMLLGCVVSAVVLTSAGSGLTKKPNVSGHVETVDYEVASDTLIGIPKGSGLASSFQGATVKSVPQPGDLSTFPPDPCFGVATVWNGILAAKLHGKAEREALIVTLQAMATNSCALEIVRDTSTSPPTIISITPVGNF